MATELGRKGNCRAKKREDQNNSISRTKTELKMELMTEERLATITGNAKGKQELESLDNR